MSTFNLTESNQNEAKYEQAFVDYVTDSGLKDAFELIFAEVIEKQIEADMVHAYAVVRLRQLAAEVREINGAASNESEIK